jgi:hypothetical protein
VNCAASLGVIVLYTPDVDTGSGGGGDTGAVDVAAIVEQEAKRIRDRQTMHRTNLKPFIKSSKYLGRHCAQRLICDSPVVSPRKRSIGTPFRPLRLTVSSLKPSLTPYYSEPSLFMQRPGQTCFPVAPAGRSFAPERNPFTPAKLDPQFLSKKTCCRRYLLRH